MNKTRALAIAGIGAGMAALTLGALAGPASAHTPDYGKDCSGYHVSLTNYGEGSTRKLVVDGSTLADGGFSGDYTKSATWDQTKSHTISLLVHSSDGPSGDVNWNATQAPCQEESTTARTPGTTVTVLATTTAVPNTTTTTRAPVSQVTTAPPTSAAVVLATTTTMPNVPTTVRQSAPPRAATPPSALPVTGGVSTVFLIMGAALTIVGVILMATVGRRRPA